MANHTQNDGKVLGRDSKAWGKLCIIAIVGFYALAFISEHPSRSALGLLLLLLAADIVFLLIAVGGWILAQVREGQAEKELEGRKEIQKFLSSPDLASRLTADPALYRRAQAELQARKEQALKMQQLHALREQVEEEERAAGIFAPNLSPTRPPASHEYPPGADPMAALMAQLAQRRIEADRQKHLMKSLRTVEDAEWEADDV